MKRLIGLSLVFLTLLPVGVFACNATPTFTPSSNANLNMSTPVSTTTPTTNPTYSQSPTPKFTLTPTPSNPQFTEANIIGLPAEEIDALVKESIVQGSLKLPLPFDPRNTRIPIPRTQFLSGLDDLPTGLTIVAPMKGTVYYRELAFMGDQNNMYMTIAIDDRNHHYLSGRQVNLHLSARNFQVLIPGLQTNIDTQINMGDPIFQITAREPAPSIREPHQVSVYGSVGTQQAVTDLPVSFLTRDGKFVYISSER